MITGTIAPWVNTDVIMLLTASLRPGQHGLETNSSDGKAEIWHIPGDYNQRIAQQQQLNDKP